LWEDVIALTGGIHRSRHCECAATGFHRHSPNWKWAGDITSVASWEGWLYLVISISRRILS
jgi:transposase InsO family protein